MKIDKLLGSLEEAKKFFQQPTDYIFANKFYNIVIVI